MSQKLLKLFNNTGVTIVVSNSIVEAQPQNSVVCVELVYIGRFNKKVQSLRYTSLDGIEIEQGQEVTNYKFTVLSELHRLGWLFNKWTVRLSFSDEEGNNSFVREIDNSFRFVRPLEDVSDTEVTIEVN